MLEPDYRVIEQTYICDGGIAVGPVLIHDRIKVLTGMEEHKERYIRTSVPHEGILFTAEQLPDGKIGITIGDSDFPSEGQVTASVDEKVYEETLAMTAELFGVNTSDIKLTKYHSNDKAVPEGIRKTSNALRRLQS